MISYLVDAALLIALAITSLKTVSMYRELRRLGAYHADYQRIFDQTALALDGIEVSIQELNVRGSQVLNALGSRMDDARDLIAEIDALTREAKRQQAILRAELKSLSAETALGRSAERFQPNDADKQAAASTSEGAQRRPRGGTGAHPLTAAAVVGPELKIHRIDDFSSGPFRSVTMNRKDDLL
ncbi:hypothetical protein [Polymorphum gilvum]|uniref:Uncharacterized protein n=1 Tax=Polymorphum gilvum (strain LMG 25793 / CGMCC 1.9160 / SL003B-26A1) TaxID=991905 RepID=F2J4M3_POLGS|nr:hypothetical protein [Polymorphum gilvum]ADZ72275.1 hypothetical protein SL003B_3855 [Polymorphum gilvum SL003B-26A1]